MNLIIAVNYLCFYSFSVNIHMSLDFFLSTQCFQKFKFDLRYNFEAYLQNTALSELDEISYKNKNCFKLRKHVSSQYSLYTGISISIPYFYIKERFPAFIVVRGFVYLGEFEKSFESNVES